jgi:thiol:disulfide interchange protein DsbC
MAHRCDIERPDPSRRLFAIVAFAAGLLAATQAAADAGSAAQAFFGNLKRLHYDTSLQATAVADDRTLVSGVYRLEDKASGELIALITESGDIKGDSTGWSWIEEGGARPLSPAEAAQLRSEMLGSIEWKKLIKVRYGGGGRRRIILVSAVNCPYCAKMEQALAQNAASLDTTFYVLPISLSQSPDHGEGLATWGKATSIWCAADNAQAWRRFWATREVPAEAHCAIDPLATFRTARNFSTAMSSIGVRLHGTPAMIREDGSSLAFPAEPDEHYFKDVLGPEGLPEIQAPREPDVRWRWLRASR